VRSLYAGSVASPAWQRRGKRRRGVPRRASAVAAAAAALVSGCGSSHDTGSAHVRAGAATEQAREPAPAHWRSAHPHRVLVGQIVERLPTRRHLVALTFDAGADNAGAPKILTALRRASATATFFVTGRWVELYPRWARQIAAKYPIGNHTFDHSDLTRLRRSLVVREIVMAQAAIKRVTHRPPSPLFRFPYGSSSASTLRIANHLGYTALGWTVDTLGWEGTSLGQTVHSVVARALGNLKPGEIILMHVGANPNDHSTLDASALPTIIDSIRARGYTLVTPSAYF
jgi:peptidoglycan/xylan/chitin deacetylase (PgdA/CDA1 family)